MQVLCPNIYADAEKETASFAGGKETARNPASESRLLWISRWRFLCTWLTTKNYQLIQVL